MLNRKEIANRAIKYVDHAFNWLTGTSSPEVVEVNKQDWRQITQNFNALKFWCASPEAGILTTDQILELGKRDLKTAGLDKFLRFGFNGTRPHLYPTFDYSVIVEESNLKPDIGARVIAHKYSDEGVEINFKLNVNASPVRS